MLFPSKKTSENFRLIYDVKGRFTVHRISNEEAKYKLCKVRKVATAPKGVPYLVTHDGGTIRYPDPLVKPNDTVQVDIATGKIKDFIKFDSGNQCMITGGHNLGRVGIIVNREPKRNKASFLTTNTNLESEEKGETRENKQTVKKCPFCKSLGHYLPNCPTFTQISLKERRKFIQEQKRSYGCLRVGHDSKNCKQKHTCQTCKGKHPTCLHNDNVVPKQENEGPSDANVHANPSAATLRTNNKGETYATSTTVPVWISTKSNPHHERLAYAILDNQSNTTFVTEEVCGALHPESEAIKLKLTTITERESNISCQRISGLQVRGYTSNVIIDIPSAYTRELIPADPTQIPSNETAKNWNHLRSIANEIPPLLDCDVDLLIGYNCSQALVPREVITGTKGSPYEEIRSAGQDCCVCVWEPSQTKSFLLSS